MSDASGFPNRNTLWATVFVQELARAGVVTACISPGSRSTPLTMALARHSAIRVYTHIDERSGSYFALGHARLTGTPVALVCTSGTAAANFHPAVIEASLGQVPLIVLTADRPPSLRDTGANQTIDQIKLYGGAVRWNFEVGTPDLTPAGLRHLRGLAARAIFEATRPPAGPVHLNFPFSKPLEPIPVAEDLLEGWVEAHPTAAEGAVGFSAGQPYSSGRAPHIAAPAEVIRRIAAQVRGAPRGLIACGPLGPTSWGPLGPAIGEGRPGENGNGSWPSAVATLARRTGYPILAEPTSGVRRGPHDTSRIIAQGESILRAPAFRHGLVPQLVLRFGGMPIGRNFEVLLEEHPDCPVVLVNEAGSWLEPTHNPTEVVAAEPAEFCRALAEALPAGTNGGEWLAAFQEADALAAEVIAGQFDPKAPEGLGGAWFEGQVFAELAALLPSGALQFTSTSMPIRDLDEFTPVGERNVRYLANRGANGIDGTLSAALGAAAALGEAGGGPALLVTGDLALYHDLNGLLAARQYGIGLTIVLINNDGGGIFEMLPIADFGELYQTHFATPHGLDFRPIAEGYGAPLLRPKNWAEFRSMVADSLAEPGTRIIEIRTDRARNRLQHQQVWDAVAERLATAFPPDRRL